MKVLDREFEVRTPTEEITVRMDLTRCTRCSAPWGYHLVEKVEIWTCSSCGYEARERSADYLRILIEQQEFEVV